ncbi:MAG: hypothetical protein LBV36_07210 [Chromatiales bacterium]|jgi:nickel transport protein|nr:hypothetical protein [Chromatiales bacterium]
MRASISLVFLGFFLLFVGAVHAHKVNMFAHVEGEQVIVEGYFADGKPAEKAKIEVLSPSGESLLTGTADAKGLFSFVIPQISDLRIVLYAGMGHRSEYTIPEAELAGATAAPSAAAESTDKVEAGNGSDQSASPVAPTEVEAMVRKAVGEAMLPVVRGLSELKEQRGVSDIVGGIGLIVGLIGVFFYVKARRMLAAGSAKSSGVSGRGSSDR